MNEVKAILKEYHDVDKGDALMIAMGRLLQIYTKNPPVKNGRTTADVVSDFETVAREVLFKRSSGK